MCSLSPSHFAKRHLASWSGAGSAHALQVVLGKWLGARVVKILFRGDATRADMEHCALIKEGRAGANELRRTLELLPVNVDDDLAYQHTKAFFTLWPQPASCDAT